MFPLHYIRSKNKILVRTILILSVILIYNQFREKTLTLGEFPANHTFFTKRSVGMKYILLWTPMFNTKNWYLSEPDSDSMTLDDKYFKSINCPVTSCVITNNKHLLNSSGLYDAIVFHINDRMSQKKDSIPTKKSVHQVYVGASLESPVNTRNNLSNDLFLYNMTMTYRMDSDIVWPYMIIVRLGSNIKVAPADIPMWPVLDTNNSNKKYLGPTRKKTKLAAWFVSHCHTQSRREDLVRDLQGFINVDIYGQCGLLECSRNSEKNCFNLLEENYKFYFAFENSLCRDYVTEKLYKYMKLLIVPVVYGGANYAQFAPPNSYIDVNNFNDTKSLAEYLMFLDKNPREYVKYFWWKEYYQLTTSTPFCDLCMKLQQNENSNKIQYYANIHDWWFSETCNDINQSKIQFNLYNVSAT